ncbi:MAG: IPExxxVDY family protein, partial [Bacteroidetes bacterium]|nr:IPExxxVDY family protein [Bacteroidota bacterium]
MKLKLDVEEITAGFFEDARLLGIVVPLKDYQFCWNINNKLLFHFRNNSDIEIQLTKKKRTYFFCVYQYDEPNSSLSHYLYKNHFDGEYLLPEFKHLDYLWLLKGDVVSNDMIHILINSIKTLNAVQL